ncbi:MAG: ankyrin repeat domain-containing protein [Chlamydiales bacterium]|nr:ankyrin repeat domain-containing protein [Chlamydiales bacterium]
MFSVGGLTGGFTPSLIDQQKEDQISKLIDGLFINKENIDIAFDIAKTMESVTLHFMLSDICNAYLKLGTEEGCRKAYKVAQYKEQQRADVRKLFDSIIETCIQIRTPNSIVLAEEIYEDNSKCLALSSHKNDFHMAKAQLEYDYETEVELKKKKSKELDTVFISEEKPVSSVSNIKSLSASLNSSDIQEIRSKDVPLPITEEYIKKSIFYLLQSGELEALCIHLGSLDSLQKSKYFSSTMKFETSWARGEEEMTPLQYACFLGNIDGVKLLIENGASVNDFRNTSDSTQRGSLHFAIDADHFDIALLLLSKGAKDRVASSDTFHAFRKYQLPEEWGGSWTCLSALHMAIIKNSHEVTRELLRTGDAKILVKASGVNSPLHLAARGGDEEMTKLLLSSGANATLNLKDNFGKTPKQVAASKKHDHLLTLLS